MGKKGFQLAIVGCGRISQAYIEAIKNCEGIQLAAVMDTRVEAADAAAEMTGSRAYTDLNKMMEENHLEGVIICTPPKYHRDQACELMNHGISVLCEKPLALSVQEGQEIVFRHWSG